MKRFSLGIRLESLGLGLRQALDEASRMGAGGLQIDAVGDLSPNRLSGSGKRAFGSRLRSLNVELAALGCPLRRGLDAFEDQQLRIDHIKEVMTLAFELGPRLVVISAGQTPDKEDTPEARRMRESLLALGQHGDRIGTRLALETGLESGETLVQYLGSFDTGSLAVNFDPANLLLNRFDPLPSLRALAGRVALIHARDCRRGTASRAGQEVPLGHGDIDWLTFVETLEEIEYREWLLVEREQGDRRVADVEAGLAFLRRIAGRE